MSISLFHPHAFLLFMGVSLLPIYSFSSGGVQPAHMVLALFSGFTLLTRGFPSAPWSTGLLAVFAYTFLVEGVYVILHGSPMFMMGSVFFLYNYILTAAVYFYVRENGLNVLASGVFIAACLAFFTVVIGGVDLREGSETGRATGTFNNPNQLGYFSVCMLSLAYLFYRHRIISYWPTAAGFGISLFLAICSLSKAAMLANSLVIILALKPASSLGAIFRWVFFAFFGLLILIYFYINGYFEGYIFIDRIESMMDEGDSSLESRGYFLFFDGNVMQIIFGHGTRGVNDILGHEVHSTFGSMVNNYGFIGLILFIFVFSIWAICLWRAYGFVGLACLAGPAILYGITHNGTRFTIFWLLFSASMAMASRRKAEQEIVGSFFSAENSCHPNIGQVPR